MRKIFVTAIGTDVGKTVVSSVLTEALQADYWKPVQCGSLDNTDSDFVRSRISNSKSTIHKEAFLLKEPMSPHAAAKLEGINIGIAKIVLPETENTLIIEGAGGLMVPLNSANLVIDLITEFNAEVVLVVKHYLGSINHTLLSIDALRNRNIPVTGIVFSGEKNEESESIILHHLITGFVGHIKQESNLTKEVIKSYAPQFQNI